jgi:hypothetical protein
LSSSGDDNPSHVTDRELDGIINGISKYMDVKFANLEKCISSLEKGFEDNIKPMKVILDQHSKDIAELKSKETFKLEESKNRWDLKKLGFQALFGFIVMIGSVVVTKMSGGN